MRIATFNCENLFARYKFKDAPEPIKKETFTIDELSFDIFNETEKSLTAKAIKEVNADIIGLQEVESLGVIDKFVEKYLGELGYKHKILIDSHDQRGIDVALLSRYPISNVRTHRDENSKNSNSYLFSRDCLEVDISLENKTLTVYVNHFKSMMGGRDKTASKRKEQAERVARIIDEKWQKIKYAGNFVVLGDLNDYPDENTSLSELLNHPELVNIINRLPDSERWTHYYNGDKTYHQLDYILVSKELSDLNSSSMPQIMRKGMPQRASRYVGPRFEGVGVDNPKASDHAPFYVDLDLI